MYTTFSQDVVAFFKGLPFVAIAALFFLLSYVSAALFESAAIAGVFMVMALATFFGGGLLWFRFKKPPRDQV